MKRTMIAAMAIVLGLFFAPALPATDAGAVTININIGSSISNGRGITCAQGERRLRNRGFRDVRRIDCWGSRFVYRGWRGGNRYEVVLRSRDGRVMSVRRIRR